MSNERKKEPLAAKKGADDSGKERYYCLLYY